MSARPPSRSEFERLVAATARHPTDPDHVRAGLLKQLRFYGEQQTAPGIDDLAGLLAGHFAAPGATSAQAIVELAGRYATEPMHQLYAFAVGREQGDSSARRSLDALLSLDPEDPMAQMFESSLAGEPVVAASEEERLANIAKLAATPLLADPYRLAVDAMFEAIKDRERARVLDVGVGSGAQMAELIRTLGRTQHAVRCLELVGLDFVDDFLDLTAGNIRGVAADLAGNIEVSFEPVSGRVESIDETTIELINGPEGLDAANASIALHEVPGERKLAALANLRALSPRRLVIAEWNYYLENTLPETSAEFVWGARSVAAAMIAALSARHSLADARRVARDWLSQGPGQLTCPAAERQECFLDVGTWVALLERSGFSVLEQRAATEPIALVVAESAA